MTLGGTWYFPSALVWDETLDIHTNSDGVHGSTAAPIAACSCNTDSVSHIVGYSDHDVCSISGECTNTWTDSDGVVD